MPIKRLQELFARSDFRSNPLKAILKRLVLRVWWYVTKRPFIVPFANNLKIALPSGGASTAIYYLGYSEPETASFILRFLKPGMVFFDIGAHIGEYALLASQLVGATGEVHTFEPQPGLFEVMFENVRMNGLKNIILNCFAISNQVGEIEFEIFKESALSSIRKPNYQEENASNIIHVATTSLDSYWSKFPKTIDLIKVDVEGAEKLVFQGAKELLSLPQNEAPTWIFEYVPDNCNGFGYQPIELIEELKHYGYEVWQYSDQYQIQQFEPDTYSSGIINLIASKNKNNLISLLSGVNINTFPQQKTVAVEA